MEERARGSGSIAVLEDADAIRVTDGGEAMRNEDGGAKARGGEEAIENFGFAADVELRGGLVEENNSGAEFYGGEGAS